MRPRPEQLPRARESWVWLGGTALLGILGAGVAAAAMLLWEKVDVRQLAPGFAAPAERLPEPDTTGPAATDAKQFVAVLFDSPRNKAFFPDTAFYVRELSLWRDLIREMGGTVRNVGNAEQLEALQPDELLVLPESPCVSREELSIVRSHLARGGSVISNWATGVRDDKCEWRGWGMLRELTDAEDVVEMAAGEARYLTLPAGVPLTHGFDPGSRIELRAEPSIALQLRGPRLYWSDWSLNSLARDEARRGDAAGSVARTREGGRTAWIAWRLGGAATASDSVLLRRIVQNGVKWAAGISSASVAAWPGGAQAAMVFVVDVEDGPQTVIDIAALFREDSIPGSYFVVTQLVAQDSIIRDALRGTGEVGSHTVDHRAMGGRTLQDQTIGLQRSFEDITKWAGREPLGFRPPEESFDKHTLAAWARAGGRYVLARNENRVASPELHTTSRGQVVLIPRLFKDDYNVIVQDRAVRGERISEAFIEGANKLHALGGVAVVAGHTQIMDTERRRDAYRIVARHAREQGGWWFARGGDVADWWRKRAAVSIRFADPTRAAEGDSVAARRDLVVSILGDTVTNIWIDVQLPDGGADLTPQVDGQSVRFARTEWGLRVPIDTLFPGRARRIAFPRTLASPATR